MLILFDHVTPKGIARPLVGLIRHELAIGSLVIDLAAGDRVGSHYALENVGSNVGVEFTIKYIVLYIFHIYINNTMRSSGVPVSANALRRFLKHDE